eukprot:CAMPEP_0181460962 /NCGR_PEP_ID=MMETSP1110-20121109/33621_1 /TAXON_ID=174948 /ORGANISM="Symbiodinium sp., Strain CCMP421" /LENGTH=55 /DNA_ID=CAMNT_0023585549 /DNA_START=1369 /DNA_END=1536 /DNA_ORIENTATION=-
MPGCPRRTRGSRSHVNSEIFVILFLQQQMAAAPQQMAGHACCQRERQECPAARPA